MLLRKFLEAERRLEVEGTDWERGWCWQMQGFWEVWEVYGTTWKLRRGKHYNGKGASEQTNRVGDKKISQSTSNVLTLD
jgi:hypothetical protein